MNNFLDELKKYFESTTQEKILEDWEADFTRKLSNELYDNHEPGHGHGHGNTPNDAVHNAYQNIKFGKKLRK